MRRMSDALLISFLVLLFGCTTDATVELTKAPFEATTALSDGTSRAIGELLDPLTELTSSTTPGAATADLMRARQQTILFAAKSYENLRSDIARGSGEYLMSLATLAGVPQERHDEFRRKMQNVYFTLFEEPLTGSESSTRIVNTAWAMGRGNTQ